MLPRRLLPAPSRSAGAAGGVAQESGAAVAVWTRENKGGSKPAQGPIVAGENDEAQTETVVENEDRDSDEDADTDDGVAKVEETVRTTMMSAGTLAPLPTMPFGTRRPLEKHFSQMPMMHGPCASPEMASPFGTDAPAGDPDRVAWTPRGVGRRAGEGVGGIGGEAARVLEQSGLREVCVLAYFFIHLTLFTVHRLRTTDVDGSYETLLVYADAGDAHMHAPPANIVLQEPPVCRLSAFMKPQALRTVVGPVPRYSIGGITRV
ncbi:hypothetical protein GGX14DRAFT_394658 [Mycena pura]|uniref:Uncharacterized protein n=1 Tax=Mycena pura TaxID=153505 RepID=A0AAD6VG52_9AGAR|nr:hypothetical protein GGX14DRAFT_394658 [Mycena pura]